MKFQVEGVEGFTDDGNIYVTRDEQAEQLELLQFRTRIAQLEHALVTLYELHYLKMRSMPEEWIDGVCKSALPESHPAHSDMPSEYDEFIKEEWHKRL